MVIIIEGFANGWVLTKSSTCSMSKYVQYPAFEVFNQLPYTCLKLIMDEIWGNFYDFREKIDILNIIWKKFFTI